MSKEIVSSLISGGTGLVGALIGFFGAWLVSRQTRKAGIEQIRYARAHERRDEVLATLYGLINDVESDFHSLLQSARKRQDQDLLKDQKKQLGNKIIEANGYWQRQYVWIPTRLSRSLISTLSALSHRLVDFSNALDSSDPVQRDETLKEIDEWLSKDSNKNLVDLRRQIQQVLGVEDDP